MQGWESLGDGVGSRPAVVALAENEVQVFFIGADGQVWDTYWDGVTWHERHAHGGEFVGNPAACSSGERIDLFARAGDGTLQHRWYEPNGWQPWESLGVTIDTDPSACSWGSDRIDLFAAAAGELLHASWDGQRWSIE